MWTSYAGVKQQYYYHEMGNLFPELRLCELSWKADKLAIDAYLPGIKLISKRTVTGSRSSRLKQKAPRR